MQPLNGDAVRPMEVPHRGFLPDRMIGIMAWLSSCTRRQWPAGMRTSHREWEGSPSWRMA
eukprot:3900267-Alexandrium_andersonii.AAC.1